MNRYFILMLQASKRNIYSQELRVENIRRDTLVWTQGMEQWKGLMR